VSPAIKYTLARLGLFLVVLLALLPIPVIDVLLKLMIAVLVSAVASWFLLRGMRDRVADRIEQSMDRRREEKEKLRAALAGETKGVNETEAQEKAQA
jgi:mannitol-specific phosphotransferase system IIBC component